MNDQIRAGDPHGFGHVSPLAWAKNAQHRGINVTENVLNKRISRAIERPPLFSHPPCLCPLWPPLNQVIGYGRSTCIPQDHWSRPAATRQFLEESRGTIHEIIDGTRMNQRSCPKARSGFPRLGESPYPVSVSCKCSQIPPAFVWKADNLSRIQRSNDSLNGSRWAGFLIKENFAGHI